MEKKLICLAVLFALLGCNDEQASSEAELEQEMVVADTITQKSFVATDVVPSLGEIYDPENKNINGYNCINGYPTDSSSVKETLLFNRDLSNEFVRTFLSSSIDSEVSFDSLPIDAGGLLTKENMESDYSSTYSMIYSFVGKQRVLYSFNTDSPETDSEFEVLCGEESLAGREVTGTNFIQKLAYGGILKFDFVVNSKTKEDLEIANNYLMLGGNGTFFDTEKALAAGLDSSNIQFVLQFAQIGGQTDELDSLVENRNSVCVVDNWRECAGLYDDALKYAVDDYSTQLEGVQIEDQVISFETAPYLHAGVSTAEQPSSLNRFKQLSVLQHLRSTFDAKMAELKALEATEAEDSAISEIEQDIESLREDYTQCQINYITCGSASFI